MELRHLRYADAVAKQENFTRAAAKLHVSRPGVSQKIDDLEDGIGFDFIFHLATCAISRLIANAGLRLQ